MKRLLKISVLSLVVFVAFVSIFHDTSYVSGTDEASLRIGEADEAVRRAFEAVLEAEKAGTNVSGPIAKLDEAGGLLTEAEIAYRNGSLSEAVVNANSSFLIAESVRDEALSLKNSTLEHAQSIVWWSLAFSSLGALAFIIALSSAWRWFKRLHVKKLSGMRPEVASDAEA
jgi:hypothetical protein